MGPTTPHYGLAWFGLDGMDWFGLSEYESFDLKNSIVTIPTQLQQTSMQKIRITIPKTSTRTGITTTIFGF